MAKTLDQIIAELNPNFQAQTKSLQDRQALIPGQIKSQETALGARKDVAFNDILSGARRRGTGVAFGGIPLAEQSKYLATDYMPALANLRSQGQQEAMSLQDAILGINERRDTLAQQIYQTEQDRDFQARQAAANRAAQQTDLSKYFNMMSQGGGQQPQAPQSILSNRNVEQTPNGGFNFFGKDGKPITAGQFAQQNKMDIRDVLFEMGQTDRGAANLYNRLRKVPDANFMSTISQIAPQFNHLLGGYVTPQFMKPASRGNVSIGANLGGFR